MGSQSPPSPNPSNQEPPTDPEDSPDLSHPLLRDIIMSEFPDSRHDRIAALRAAIESGTYTVQAQDVADKLLQELSRNPPTNPPSSSS